MGLDRDILDIHENYMNYINSNPKIVNRVDELVVADTGKTGNYLTLDYPCNNKKIAVIPLPIHIPNGEITTSTHTALLSKTNPTIEARKSHIFPCLSKYLLSIVSPSNFPTQAVFDEKKVLIINKGNGKK